MKWFILTLTIWNDGAYTFAPSGFINPKLFETEAECEKAKIPIVHMRHNNVAVSFSTEMCITESAWNNFQYNWNGTTYAKPRRP